MVQIAELLAGASNKNIPNLRNLAMELRKLCCHPVRCSWQGLNAAPLCSVSSCPVQVHLRQNLAGRTCSLAQACCCKRLHAAAHLQGVCPHAHQAAEGRQRLLLASMPVTQALWTPAVNACMLSMHTRTLTEAVL